MKFVSHLYTPIVKAKRGELVALEQLAPAVADVVLPLFEIPPVDLQQVRGNQAVPKKEPPVHLHDVAKQAR